MYLGRDIGVDADIDTDTNIDRDICSSAWLKPGIQPNHKNMMQTGMASKPRRFAACILSNLTEPGGLKVPVLGTLEVQVDSGEIMLSPGELRSPALPMFPKSLAQGVWAPE